MRRENETYRLVEDHFTWGLEGRLTLGKHITYDNLCLFELIKPTNEDYPLRVTVDDSSNKQSGTYAFENNEDVKVFIKKIIGGSYGGLDEVISKSRKIDITSHKGKFSLSFKTQN